MLVLLLLCFRSFSSPSFAGNVGGVLDFKIVYFVGFKICGDKCLEFKISMGLGRLFGRDGCFLNGLDVCILVWWRKF